MTERLKHYPWPGNARQLENEVKRLVASVRGPAIASNQLDLVSEPGETGEQEKDVSFEGRTIDEVSGEIERRMIEDALKNITIPEPSSAGMKR